MKKRVFLPLVLIVLLGFVLPQYACAESAPLSDEEQEKVIYLTYDDGPYTYTEDLLDLLDEYGAKATFFVVGDRVERIPDPVRDAAERGHAIGIHCYKHIYDKIYASEEAFFDSVDRTYAAIENICGCSPRFLRFPGGSATARSYMSRHIDGGFDALKQRLADRELLFFDWDAGCDECSDGAYGAFLRAKRCCAEIDNPILLMHDTQYGSVSVTRKILEWGTANGYVFRSLDEWTPET